MKNKLKFSKYLKSRRIFMSISCFASLIMFIILGTIFAINFQDLEGGLIMFGIAAVLMVIYLIGLAVFNHFITKAEKEEKEAEAKDERIKELEEALKRVNDDNAD